MIHTQVTVSLGLTRQSEKQKERKMKRVRRYDLPVVQEVLGGTSKVYGEHYLVMWCINQDSSEVT